MLLDREYTRVSKVLIIKNDTTRYFLNWQLQKYASGYLVYIIPIQGKHVMWSQYTTNNSVIIWITQSQSINSKYKLPLFLGTVSCSHKFKIHRAILPCTPECQLQSLTSVSCNPSHVVTRFTSHCALCTHMWV